MRSWWVLGFTVVAASACRCGEGLESVQPGFAATPERLDFGRVLEGRRADLTVTLAAETRAAGTITAVTSAPFSSARSVELPGGTQLDLPVAFLAGDGEATGTLVLTIGQQSRTVTLRGVGVRPPTCTPSASCLRSAYSLELDRCVETQAPDGTTCDPGSLCLEQGECKVGQCLGVQRRCDDNDACTLDGCSPSTGCVHTPTRCPQPSNRCRVATCDAAKGCGEATAPDGALCGPASCVSTSICATGACTAVDTPEGTPCGNAFACLPVGACRAKQCARPDAGDWRPAWSTELPGVPASQSPALLANQTSVFFPLCGVTLDAGEPLDGGDDDGGRCGLYSWTSSGFDRFSAPLGEARQLVHVSAQGVLLLGDGGLELRALNSGARLGGVDVPGTVDMVASASDGAVLVLRDGGEVLAWTDAGLGRLATLGEGGAVALDNEGGLFSWTGGGQLMHVAFVEAGPRLSTVALDAGERSLTVAGLTAVVGLGAAVTVDAEAGVLLTALDQGDLVQNLLPRGVLQSADQVAFFTRRCPTPQLCDDAERTDWVSMNDLRTGAQQWSMPISSFGSNTEVRLVEPALFDLTGLSPTASMGVGALHEVSNGEVSRLAFQVFGQGQRLLQCPLPARSPHAHGAVFQGHQLFVLVERADGGSALEAYDLLALPLYQGGWSAPGGVQGSRRSP